MKIDCIKGSDVDQIFERFCKATVSRNDITALKVPESGFYEYPLTHADLVARAQLPFSLVMKDDSGSVISYIISYSVAHAKKLPKTYDDPVHEAFNSLDAETLYADQFFLEKGQPIFLAMRLIDAWDHIAQNERVPSVITAIPHEPWRNRSSERIVLYRGLKREGFIDGKDFRLAIFSKPYYL